MKSGYGGSARLGGRTVVHGSSSLPDGDLAAQRSQPIVEFRHILRAEQVRVDGRSELMGDTGIDDGTQAAVGDDPRTRNAAVARKTPAPAPR